MQTFMPKLNSESGFVKFMILNLTVLFFLVFFTWKKNHWVWPFVFMSFCIKRLYSLSVTFYARYRFPDSNLDSNNRVLSSGST